MSPAQSLDEGLLQALLEGTASETGAPFFDHLVRHLAAGLQTRCAWVTEWLPESRRLRALSFWVDGDYRADFEYAVADTPCEPVVDGADLVHIPERVIELYPRDPDLPPLGAVSYMGAPLRDGDGSLLGHLAVLHDRPLPQDPRAEAVFRIFAARAAAELRRLQRDRALGEREQKLARLIDSAMDGIVELDASLHVSGMNRAAESLFRAQAADWIGRPFRRLLTDASHRGLARLARELPTAPADRQAVWIPEGFSARRSDGTSFPAEATLSRFELEGRDCFSLILRNVDERLEAEARIASLRDETLQLRAELDSLRGFDAIIGHSDALQALLDDVERVAESPTTVLIAGETGTGKELVARAIHQRSPRAVGPLVTVNCAAIPESLQESEFFGHEKGAFTGATARRVGRFKLADGGTLFLDEVGELPPDLQAKLLRVLQEGEFEPVGAQRSERVDVRVVAATHRDLEAMVRQGSFREDLMYRLNVFPLRVPPLRERGDDVVLLARHFARSLAERAGRPAPELGEADARRLLAYDWPGNVRELRNVIERALLTSADPRRLDLERALPGTGRVRAESPPGDPALPAPILTASELRDLERANTLRALEASDWKVSGPQGAAERLGLNPNTLASRMKSLGIRRARP